MDGQMLCKNDADYEIKRNPILLSILFSSFALSCGIDWMSTDSVFFFAGAGKVGPIKSAIFSRSQMK